MSHIKSLMIASVSALSLALGTSALAYQAQDGQAEDIQADAETQVVAQEVIQADIVDTAIATEGFSTLVAAVQAADLVETLKGEGPFTVFAPTDDAFAALPEGTVEMLLKPENKDKLAAVLTYHVVSGKVLSSDLSGVITVGTVQGSEVTIDATDGVKVGAASVTTADIETSNGVIHVIDSVILPADLVL